MNILFVDVGIRLTDKDGVVEHVVREGAGGFLYSKGLLGKTGKERREVKSGDVRCILCPLIIGNAPDQFERFEIVIRIGEHDSSGGAPETYSFDMVDGKFNFRRQSDRTVRQVSPNEIRRILRALLNERNANVDFLSVINGPDMCRPECDGYAA
ncbi:MAG: hypothetical protein HGA38_01105 [Candidatus Moranbacteria bacterium]|nr:hypothetical protein [Candidatus Moranbacteria bacterium]